MPGKPPGKLEYNRRKVASRDMATWFEEPPSKDYSGSAGCASPKLEILEYHYSGRPLYPKPRALDDGAARSNRDCLVGSPILP